MDKSALLVSSAAFALALCAGAPGSLAACFPPAGASSGPPVCGSATSYIDANGNAQAVDSAHPLPTGFIVSGVAVVSGVVVVTQGASGSAAWPVTVSGSVAQGASGASAWPVTVSGSVAQGASGSSAWPVTVSGTPTVSVTPSGLATTSTSGVITSGNVWQNILAASPTRQGCTIVNTSSASGVVEQVSFTTSGLAVSGAAIFLTQYQRVDCAVGAFGVRTDAVSITSSVSGATASWAVLAN